MFQRSWCYMSKATVRLASTAIATDSFTWLYLHTLVTNVCLVWTTLVVVSRTVCIAASCTAEVGKLPGRGFWHCAHRCLFDALLQRLVLGVDEYAIPELCAEVVRCAACISMYRLGHGVTEVQPCNH